MSILFRLSLFTTFLLQVQPTGAGNLDDITIELARQVPFAVLIAVLFWRFMAYQAKQNDNNAAAIQRRDVADEKSEERRIESERRHFEMMNRLETADNRRDEEHKQTMLQHAAAMELYAQAQKDAALAVKALDERTSHQITVSQNNQAAIQTLNKTVVDLHDFGMEVASLWTGKYDTISVKLQEIERLVTLALENPKQNEKRINELEKSLRADFAALCDTVIEAIKERCEDDKPDDKVLPLAS